MLPIFCTVDSPDAKHQKFRSLDVYQYEDRAKASVWVVVVEGRGGGGG